MEYEEYKRISHRSDISAQCYHDVVEPFYMAVEIDKENFCKITALMTPMTLFRIGKAFQSRREIAEVHNQEMSEIRQNLENVRKELESMRNQRDESLKEISELKNELRIQDLKIAFRPDETVRGVRSDLFLEADRAKREAIKYGIISE